MVVTHTHMKKINAKGQSVRKIEWKQTDGQTDGAIALPRANAVGILIRLNSKDAEKRYKTSPPQSNLGRTRRRPSVTMGCLKFTPNCPLPSKITTPI